MQKRFVFLCVRVYSNGEAKETVRDLEGVVNWLAYNRRNRWGNALFVNGVRAHASDRGYFNETICRRIELLLTADYERRYSSLTPEPTGPQVDMIGGHAHRYFGYGPEAHRARFVMAGVA